MIAGAEPPTQRVCCAKFYVRKRQGTVNGCGGNRLLAAVVGKWLKSGVAAGGRQAEVLCGGNAHQEHHRRLGHPGKRLFQVGLRAVADVAGRPVHSYVPARRIHAFYRQYVDLVYFWR